MNFKSNTQRLNWIHKMYNEDEIEVVLKTYSQEIVTNMANEMVQLKTKYEEGGELDTDENAKKTVMAVVDELADRIKWELRNRVALSEMENKIEKKDS